MSELDLKSVNATTGTYKVAQQPAQPSSRVVPPSGNEAPDDGKTAPKVNVADIASLAGQLENISRSIGRDLRFQVDMETGRSVIQVLDRETGEIIRQIPPENAKTYVSSQGDVALRLYDDRV